MESTLFAFLFSAGAVVLAEMGDKTQLATIALATKFPLNPIGILMGTTTGMLIADGVGIIVGVVMCKKIPERIIKLISAAAFIFFGLVGSYQVAYDKLHMEISGIMIVITVIIALTGMTAYYLIRNNKNSGSESSTVTEYCSIDHTEHK